MKTKVCLGPCGRTLSLNAFSLDSTKPDGHRARCKECRNAAHQTTSKPTPFPGLKTVKQEEVITVVEEHRLKQQVIRLESERKKLIADLSDAQYLQEIARAASAVNVKGITIREKQQGKKREATILACASDWHIEEEVKPDQVANRNRYNLEISAKRMERFFESVRWGCEFNREVFTIRDLVLWLGGDIITGYIHDDNKETNLLSPVQAVAYAQASISAGIAHLLKDGKLERLVIPCNDGNHGRLTGKMRAASRVENSIEWLLYTSLAREWAHEPRVQFIIATSPQLYYSIYGRTIRFTHGDTVNYQGGVGGVTIPIYKALARWDTVRQADLTVMGHFHQLTQLRDLIINGSLIGYNAYAATIGARFEPPAQALTVLEPLRFNSISIPLWVSDRADDEVTR